VAYLECHTCGFCMHTNWSSSHFWKKSWKAHMLKVSSFLFLEIGLEGALVETSTFYFGV
jgi:hypothetical protein